MYKSPIEVYYKDMRTKIENNIFEAVCDVGVSVDKDELVKALQYDRGQYEKGYADGLLHRADEWISVDERLPENGVHCLVVCTIKRIDGTHGQYVCVGYHAERFKNLAYGVDDDCVQEYNEENDEYYIAEGWYEVIKNWDDYGFVAIDDTVTHWMPLPEPPTMRKEDEGK